MTQPSLLAVAGLVVLAAVSWLMTGIFFFLARNVRRDPRVRLWTIGQLLLALAPTFGSVPFVIWTFGGASGLAVLSEWQIGRLLFFGFLTAQIFGFVFLYAGLTEHARAQRHGLSLLVASTGAVLVVAGISAWSNAPSAAQAAKAAVLTIVLLASSWVLCNPRRRLASEGERIAWIALVGCGLFWGVNALNASTTYFLGAERGKVGGAVDLFFRYQGLVLTVLHSALGMGLILMLTESLRDRMRDAQRRQSELAMQLLRSQRAGALGSMAAAVAHDLNNPLTAILGFAGELENKAVDAEQRECATIVREQAERCRSIVQRLSATQPEYPVVMRVCRASEVAERTARGVNLRAQQAGVRLDLSVEAGIPELTADPYGLEEALENLLDNAILATPHGGAVRLSVNLVAHGVEFRVQDGGAGVPASRRARIFDAYYSHRSSGAGSGIGLTVAQALVAAHGGTLTLEPSEPGWTGACFRMSIPWRAAPAAPTAVTPTHEREARGLALVVEGHALARRILRRWLTDAGWSVMSASDVHTAHELIRQHEATAELLIWDLDLPAEEEAPSIAWLARKVPALLARAVFLTEQISDSDELVAARAHGYPILVRPLNLSELDAAIHDLGTPRPRAARGRGVPAGLALLGCSLLMACSRSDPADSAESGAEELALPIAAGALYEQHCALCHGPNGDGDGTLTLDRPARSFRQGGFSFGNTEDAVFRTISSGIGGTPMPGFAHLLAEDERRALARHVIGLGPEQVPGPGFASILTVGDRPVVVRGQFAPVVEGGPDFSRGLLVGNPDGLSYQYAADDLRLLAVRQGPFVDRKDWGERGGLPLEPLGRVVYLALPDGNPAPEWMIDHRFEAVSRLLSTRMEGDAAVLTYELLDPEGLVCATVHEHCQALGYSAAFGFRRSFEITGATDRVAFNALFPVSDSTAPPLMRGDASASNFGLLLRRGGFAPDGFLAEDGRIELEYLLLPDGSELAWAAVETEIGR